MIDAGPRPGLKTNHGQRHESPDATPQGGESSHRGLTALAWAAGLAAMLYFAFSVLLAPTATVGLAAQPWPDGAEYLDAAVHLERYGRSAIHIGGEEHPSRYPVGFSLITATALALGVEPAVAPYRVNQAAGLLLLLLMTAIVARAWCALEAGLSALLLATFPSFVLLCRSPLSEISASLLVFGGAALLYAYSRGGPLSQGAGGAALLGLATSFRLSNLFLAPLAVAALVARRKTKGGPNLRHAVIVGAAMGAGLIPFFASNWISMGDPLETGYGYWVPYWAGSQAFGLEFLRPNLHYDLLEFLQRETRFTTANLYGAGSYFGPALVLSIGWALWVLRKDIRLMSFALAGALYYAIMKLYFFQDARLIFPVFLLAIPIVAKAIGHAWRRASGSRLQASLGCVLLLTTVVGFPATEGYSETAATLSVKHPASPGYRFIQQLARIQDAAPKLILTDLNPPYVHAVSEPGTLVAPLQDDHQYRNNPEVFHFDRGSRLESVTRALDEGRSVWAVTHKLEIRAIHRNAPAPDGYAWEIVATSADAGLASPGLARPGLARLVAR